MVVWLSVAAIVFSLLLAGLWVLYTRQCRGEVQRSDVIAGAVLVLVALLLVIASELIAREISGAIFFLWLPLWLYWHNRKQRHQA